MTNSNMDCTHVCLWFGLFHYPAKFLCLPVGLNNPALKVNQLKISAVIPPHPFLSLLPATTMVLFCCFFLLQLGGNRQKIELWAILNNSFIPNIQWTKSLYLHLLDACYTFTFHNCPVSIACKYDLQFQWYNQRYQGDLWTCSSDSIVQNPIAS